MHKPIYWARAIMVSMMKYYEWKDAFMSSTRHVCRLYMSHVLCSHTKMALNLNLRNICIFEWHASNTLTDNTVSNVLKKKLFTIYNRFKADLKAYSSGINVYKRLKSWHWNTKKQSLTSAIGVIEKTLWICVLNFNSPWDIPNSQKLAPNCSWTSQEKCSKSRP